VASSWFSLYSTIKMMHGPINIRFEPVFGYQQDHAIDPYAG